MSWYSARARTVVVQVHAALTKVDDVNLALALAAQAVHEIGRLEVAVDEALHVERLDGCQHLKDNAQRHRRRKQAVWLPAA